MQATETVEPGTQPELEADLQRLVRLVEESRVEEARALAPALAAKWPDSPGIRHLARVLEPPKILPNRPGPRGRHLDREYAWLQAHAREYPGCWLAVYEDRLLAADPDRRVVTAAARAALGDEPALLFFQPAELP
jgi:hypothetical protein